MQPMIFVGGAPRSGTTVTHALLCTSQKTSPYHAEISFVRPLFNAYCVGMQNWEAHTRAFFKNPAEFKVHMRKCLNHSLNHLVKIQGNPEILCVKDPLLTPLFYWVQDLFPERVKLVTVVRNPYNVVRSRQEVIEKTGLAFTVGDAAATAHEYMKSYLHIDAPSLQSSLFVLRYEDLMETSVLEQLRSFTGCDDIDPAKVWAETRQANAAAAANPWMSPKYYSAINTESRLSPLAAEYMAVVDRICAPMMNRFNYPLQAG